MNKVTDTCKYIFQKNDEILMVDTTNQGKLINYTAPTEENTGDAFTIGLSHDSLRKLKERSQRNIFEWMIKDNSLVIRGKDDKWDLKFKSLQIPNLSVDVFLSEDETEILKNSLFDSMD